MGEVIVITSGKGGVGKTTTTANIGAGLSEAGKKVVVIDTDLGLRNLDGTGKSHRIQPGRCDRRLLSLKTGTYKR